MVPLEKDQIDTYSRLLGRAEGQAVHSYFTQAVELNIYQYCACLTPPPNRLSGTEDVQ